MQKIINYRCDDCGHDEEDYVDSNKDTPPTMKEECPKCKGRMTLFNIKNNCGRWRYIDTVRGD